MESINNDLKDLLMQTGRVAENQSKDSLTIDSAHRLEKVMGNSQ